MALRKPWKYCYEYKRILDILNDYWLTEPNEDVVEVDMRFLHSNGESQAKSIIWRNKTNPTNVIMVGRNAIPKPLITFEKSIEKPHKTKKGAVR